MQLNSSEGCTEIISASGEVGISVIMELCQCGLNGKGDKKLRCVLQSKAVTACYEDC